MNPTRVSIAVLTSVMVFCPALKAESYRVVLRAAQAFEEGQGAWKVQLNEDKAVVLYDRVLIEDDGPGIGSVAEWMKTDRAPTTVIGGRTLIKKVLHIDRLGACEARLCVPEEVAVEFNGRPVEVSAATPFPQVPVSLLKEGDNQVVLSCPGERRRPILYALPEDILRNAPERKDRPQRSFTSTDGGKAWQPLRGEYMVRLHLVQYVDQGELISPVLDLGQEQKGFCPLLTAVTIQSLSLTADAATPAGTEVKLVVRTGPSPVYEPALWSDWRLAGAPVPKEHRYLQWKAVLRSRDPHHTPMLRAVTVDVTRQRQAPPAWAKSLRVVSLHNEQIRSTSLPFEYEDPQHPRLVTLRRQYHLDAVVSGAKTETEKLVKLQDWVAHQWKYTPPATNYPPWDANEILRRKYGFCVQYAIVLMQSALSLGHQARFVFGYNPLAKDASGHEVCEVWSNEHRKWILLDGNQNWHYVRTPTNVPMSMLEVHDLLLWRYYPGRGVSDMDTVDRRLPADELGICYGPQLIPGTPPPDCPNHFVEGRIQFRRAGCPSSTCPGTTSSASPIRSPKRKGAAGTGRSTGAGRMPRHPNAGSTATSPLAAATWTGRSTRSGSM